MSQDSERNQDGNYDLLPIGCHTDDNEATSDGREDKGAKDRPDEYTYATSERDPTQPDVPTMKDIGCQDAPALGYLVLAPKGLPDPVYKVLSDAIRKVTEGPDFQRTLTRLEIPYDYKDRRQLEKETAEDFYVYKAFLEKMGVKPE